MTTKTKMSGGTIAGIVVILALASLVGLNRWSTPTDKLQGDERHVTVSAIWTPSPRAGGHDVRIEVRIDEIHDVTLRNTAPFSQTYTVVKGQRVEVSAVVRAGPSATLLGCSIAVNGTEVVSDHRNNAGVGEIVDCWAVA